MGTSFISPDLNYFGSKLSEMMQPFHAMSKFHFAQWNNVYQSNRELSDEIRYVFQRRKLEPQTSNLLQRPSLLIKRNFLQTTRALAENLAQGTSYGSYEGTKNVDVASNYETYGFRGGPGGPSQPPPRGIRPPPPRGYAAP